MFSLFTFFTTITLAIVSILAINCYQYSGYCNIIITSTHYTCCAMSISIMISISLSRSLGVGLSLSVSIRIIVIIDFATTNIRNILTRNIVFSSTVLR